MGAVIAIAVIAGFALISFMITSARTTARKSTNSAFRRSLDIVSAGSAKDLNEVIVQGLVDAGLRESGSFDGARFFRVNSVAQLDLKVWTSGDHAVARISLESVRSTNGRPVKLRPVAVALASAERSVRRFDPNATIS